MDDKATRDYLEQLRIRVSPLFNLAVIAAGALDGTPPPVVPPATFSDIMVAGGNTVIAEYRALAANMNYDAGTGLVNQVNDVSGNGKHLTNAGGAVCPAFAAPDSSTIANDGLLPGLGYITHNRTNNTVLSNAALNRPGTHFFAMLMRPGTYVSTMRYLASLGASNIQVFYAPTAGTATNAIFTGTAVVGIAQTNAPVGEWILVMGQFNGGTDHIRWKGYFATGNAGTNTSTGFQIGRDVAASTAGNFDWHWLALATGSPTLAQRNQIRAMVNAWATWDSYNLAHPPAGEDILIVGEGDSKMTDDGSGGGGELSYLRYLTTAGRYFRVKTRSHGGDRLSNIDAQFSTASLGPADQYEVITNADYVTKQIALLDAGTNDFANNVTATAALASLDSILTKYAAISVGLSAPIKVIVATQNRGNYTGPQDTERKAYNAGVRARLGTTIAGVAEMCGEDVGGAQTIPGTYGDGVYWLGGALGNFHNTTLVNQTVKAPIWTAQIALI